MWTIKINKVVGIISLIVFLLFVPNLVQAQEFLLNNKESTVTVYGTSSLHDWHIVADTKSGKVAFGNLESGEMKQCEFAVVAESLKSGKNSMDKNTYKALKTDAYKTITFKLAEVKDVVNKGSNKFLIKCTGNLKITDVTKLIPMEFDVDIMDGKITLTGEKSIKMTDYNVDPPKALLGTITTGNEITIKFKTIYR